MNLASLIRGKGASGKFATATPATFATQERGKGGTVASVATVAVATARKPIPEAIPAPPAKVCPGETSTASCWWLIHYPDREPLELACYPDATHAEILERHPDAVVAEPIPPKPAPVPACNTCQHRPPRHRDGNPAPCGDPVAAGLSDVPGVIRYSPDNGKTCKAWRARLDPVLKRRILAMAERWHYSGDELALALDGARSAPDGWRRVLEHDEGGE